MEWVEEVVTCEITERTVPEYLMHASTDQALCVGREERRRKKNPA